MSNYYTVKWEIDIDADNPIEAAKLAWKIMKEPVNEASFLDVSFQEGEHIDNFDMNDLPNTHVPIGDLMPIIIDKGIRHSNYCSDLYLWVTEETTSLINNYQYKSIVKKFVSETDGKLMYEIPFAYYAYANGSNLK